MNLNVTFPLVLLGLVLLTGIITLLDKLVFANKRAANAKRPWVIDYARSFFPVLLLVFIIRSFLFQPYRVPTGSLEPTIMPGDFIIVAQYAYGLRLPVTGTKLLSLGAPKRGDVILFRWPKDPNIVYAKRLIGLPGDKIEYRDKTLYINGKVMPQTMISKTYDREPDLLPIQAIKKRETLGKTTHNILLHINNNTTNFSVVVPKGHYFMMGDNRDNSYDSRYWGTVADKYLIGKALATWMSWDSNRFRIRWKRIGRPIH